MLRLVIETDSAKRMAIMLEHLDGSGEGYRLAGRKYDGTGSPVVRAVIDAEAARAIRSFLDRAFPEEGEGDAHGEAD